MKSKEHYSQRVYLLDDDKIDFNEFSRMYQLLNDKDITHIEMSDESKDLAFKLNDMIINKNDYRFVKGEEVNYNTVEQEAINDINLDDKKNIINNFEPANFKVNKKIIANKFCKDEDNCIDYNDYIEYSTNFYNRTFDVSNNQITTNKICSNNLCLTKSDFLNLENNINNVSNIQQIYNPDRFFNTEQMTIYGSVMDDRVFSQIIKPKTKIISPFYIFKKYIWNDGDRDRQVISSNNNYLKDYINTTQIGTTEDTRVQKQFPIDCLYKTPVNDNTVSNNIDCSKEFCINLNVDDNNKFMITSNNNYKGIVIQPNQEYLAYDNLTLWLRINNIVFDNNGSIDISNVVIPRVYTYNINKDTGDINNLRVTCGIQQNKKFYNSPLDKMVYQNIKMNRVLMTPYVWCPIPIKKPADNEEIMLNTDVSNVYISGIGFSSNPYNYVKVNALTLYLQEYISLDTSLTGFERGIISQTKYKQYLQSGENIDLLISNNSFVNVPVINSGKDKIIYFDVSGSLSALPVSIKVNNSTDVIRIIRNNNNLIPFELNIYTNLYYAKINKNNISDINIKITFIVSTNTSITSFRLFEIGTYDIV